MIGWPGGPFPVSAASPPAWVGSPFAASFVLGERRGAEVVGLSGVGGPRLHAAQECDVALVAQAARLGLIGLEGAEQDGDEELWRAVEHEVGVLGGSWTGLDPPFAGGEGERLVAGS